MGVFRNEALTFDPNAFLPLAGGTMSGSIQVAVDNSIDLGAAGTAWRNLFVRNVDSPAALKIGPTTATSVELGRAGQPLQANANLTPDATNTRTLGSATLVWSNVFARSLTSDAGLAIDSAGALTVAPTNATSLGLGRAAITTTVNGLLRYDNTDGAAHSPTGVYLVVNVGGATRYIELQN